MRIVRVVIAQSLNGELILNTLSLLADNDITNNVELSVVLGALGYIGVGGGVSPTPAVGSLGAQIKAAQINTLSYEFMEARLPYDPVPIVQRNFPSGYVGDETSGEATAPQVAVSIRPNKVRGDVKVAPKRFGGISSVDVGEYGDLTASGISRWTPVADLMNDLFAGEVGGFTNNFRIVTESLEKVVVDGKTTYKLWDNEADAIDALAIPTAWTLQDYTTTQNTRKRGRGA